MRSLYFSPSKTVPSAPVSVTLVPPPESISWSLAALVIVMSFASSIATVKVFEVLSPAPPSSMTMISTCTDSMAS